MKLLKKPRITSFAQRGTTGNRPAPAMNGHFRYNTDVQLFEFFQDGQWVNLDSISGLLTPNPQVISTNNVVIIDTSTTVIDMFARTDYRSVKYIISLSNAAGSAIYEIELSQSGSATTLVEYGINSIGPELGFFDAQLVSSKVRLMFTPYYPGTTVTIYQQYTPCIFDPAFGNSWTDGSNPILIDNWLTRTKQYFANSVSTVTVDQFSPATYRSGVYNLQITNGEEYYLHKIYFLYTGTDLLYTTFPDSQAVSSVLGTFSLEFLNPADTNSDIILKYSPSLPSIDLIFYSAFITSAYTTSVNMWNGTRASIASSNFQTATTSPAVITSINTALYTGGMFQIQMSSNTDFAYYQVSLTYTATEASITSYNNLGTELGVFDAQLNGGNVELIFTPYSSTPIDGIIINTLLKT